MSAIGRGVITVTGAGGDGGGVGLGMGFIITIPVIVGSLAGGHIYSANAAHPWIIMTGTLIACTALSVAFIREPHKKEV
jgi:hypothetical protein